MVNTMTAAMNTHINFFFIVFSPLIIWYGVGMFIQKSGPAGWRNRLAVSKELDSVSSDPFQIRRKALLRQKNYQYRQVQTYEGNGAGKQNGRHDHGVHHNNHAAGEALRGAESASLCTESRSALAHIHFCRSKTEHCMTTFHVSLIFDGLIVAREAGEVNIAYSTKKKGTAARANTLLNNSTKNAAGKWTKWRGYPTELALLRRKC